MRIGVMLRDIGNQLDAPGIIILNLVEEMLALDTRRHYVLFLPNDNFVDRFRAYPNATPRVIRVPTRLLWDQIGAPLAARREQVDLVFHPKHSLPLLTGRKTVMHLRGNEYVLFPHHFTRPDLLYTNIFLPLFCAKATHLIAESDSVKESFQETLNIPDHKISRIYLAPSNRFQASPSDAELAACRASFDLPDEFILTVTRVVQGKKFYPGKNIERILEAYRHSQARRRTKLVIVGRQTRSWLPRLLDPGDDLMNDLIVLDAVAQSDLPPLYTLAKMFLFPSIYESFGIPIVEAMSCGCPVITSTTFSCQEIGGDAALLVDPTSTNEITAAIDRLDTDPDLRQAMAAKGRQRAGNFTWRQAALETLAIFDRIEAATGTEATPLRSGAW